MAHHLHALVGEIAGEAAQRQAGPVHGRLADDAFEVASLREQFHLQLGGMFLEELFNREGVVFHTFVPLTLYIKRLKR